jgi:hypothetical protein
MEVAEPDPVRSSLERALGSGYRILRLLGRGGMGSVYLARDQSLERLVAVKVLAHERSLDESSRERFRREARTAARLTHPNIVPLHAFGEADGMMYLVMGYVPGESLAARLRRDGRLAVADARRIVADLADALDHAHRQGVVHRDVKPDNVLIDDESGRALLADFGIARGLGTGGTLTQAGAVIGTPQYMSPEQSAGKELDGRSDLYSLGAVAYTLLAGRPPFEGKDAGSVLAQHLTQDPPALRSLRPDVPDETSAAVMRCLSKDPAARWPDARAFREAIAPTGLDEEELPEPLDALDGMGPALLPLLILFTDAAFYAGLKVALAHAGALPVPADVREALAGQGGFSSTFTAHAAVIGALNLFLVVMPAGVLLYQLPWLASAARQARRRGFSRRQVLGAFLRQPTWWYLFWYPRRFRRAGDVWDRLPLPFRLWRLSMTLIAAAWVLLAPPFIYTFAHPETFTHGMLEQRGAVGVVYAWWVFLGSVPLALLSLALCARHVLSLKLEVFERRRVTSVLLSRPTARRSIWKRPEIARLLLPPDVATPAPTEPRLPREFADALAREAASGDPASRKELEAAAGDARALVEEIEALDAEIARLAGDADPEEAARVQQRLDALGPESEVEGDERRSLRRLLAEQKHLLDKVGERLAQARARRDERADALRELWRRSRADATATRTATRATPT